MSTDSKILNRVRALLAKAESTNFPEEADALTAKAQELMAAHSITEAMASVRAGANERPTSTTLVVEAPYVTGKVHLITAIAKANRCQAVWTHGATDTVTVFGFKSDIEATELLFTSLLLQATSAMLAEGSKVDAWGRSRTRSFRQSFLLGFAARIGTRLEQAKAQAESDAEPGVGLVLVDRDAQVASAVTEAFPRIRKHRASASNAGGWGSGGAAANRANLGQGSVGGARAALGR